MSDEATISALKWWSDAGVDTIVAETPRNWLVAPAAAVPMPRPVPNKEELVEVAQETAAPPTELAEFRKWLIGEDALFHGVAGAPRLDSSGNPNSGLMIMVGMPSAADIQAGSLLSGEAGDLFDRMLAAVKLGRESIYLASLSPFRSPTGRIDPRTAEACARLARLHIGLAAPKALLLLGDDCSTALLGRPVSAARGVWHEIETNRGPIRTLVTIRPDKLLAQPALKKLAWQDLQMLMEGYKT